MSMIDLGRKPEKATTALPPAVKQPEIYYPSFYCDRDLGLDEKDAGKIITALVKLKVVEVGKRVTEDNSRHNTDFKVMSIDLSPKNKRHYKKEE